MKQRRKKNYVKMLVYRIKRKCIKLGWDFDLEEQDIQIPQKCPVLGIPLLIDIGNGRTDNTPSIDRVDNDRGYVKDNIIVVSWRANRLKSDATPEELRRIARFYGR